MSAITGDLVRSISIDPETYTRAATHFRNAWLDDRYVVTYIDGTEGTGICCVSIRDTRSAAPGVRILMRSESDDYYARADEEDGLAGVRGLTLYGTHKWDRPSLATMEQINPAHAELFRRAISKGRQGR